DLHEVDVDRDEHDRREQTDAVLRRDDGDGHGADPEERRADRRHEGIEAGVPARMHDDEGDDEERHEGADADQIEMTAGRLGEDQMGQSGEQNEKYDPEPLVSTDLRQGFDSMRTLELLLERRLEFQSREPPQQLQRMRRLQGSTSRYLRVRVRPWVSMTPVLEVRFASVGGVR